MNEEEIKQPAYGERNFVCPHCGVLSLQNWEDRFWSNNRHENTDARMCVCEHCKKYTLWKGLVMIYPDIVTAPIAHPDMSENIREIYDEAREVSPKSSRAAAALLRVALEELTNELGETEGSLNQRIGNLKSKGLPDRVIKSLDIVRINANEGGSHSGTIDLSGEDGQEIVNKLFWLVNYIIEKTISENKDIDTFFEELPENKKDGIENRDNKT